MIEYSDLQLYSVNSITSTLEKYDLEPGTKLYGKELLTKLIEKGVTNPIPFIKELVLQGELEEASTKEIEEFEENFKKSKKQAFEQVKKLVITHLLQGKSREATEIISKFVEKVEEIKSIRNDEKSEIWIYKKGIYVPEGKSYIKEISRRILGPAFTTQKANEIIEKVKVDTYISQEEFFSNEYPKQIVLENGIYDLEHGVLKGYTNKKFLFNKLPICYDPKAKCPNFIKHLNTVLKNPEDVPVMQEIFGFCLLKEYKFEKAFMFVGDGRNGKGKTVEVLKRLLGPQNCTNIPIQQFEEDQFSLSELHNKMANIGADIDSSSLKHTGTFKSLTGRDLLSAPRKYLPRINFVNYAKQVFCTNQLPKTYDLTPAFFERWILLEFPFTFLPREEFESCDDPKVKLADEDIVQKLTTKEELSGIFNWALEGLKRLISQHGFSYTKNMDQVKTIWTRKSDSFLAFSQDCLIEDYDGVITKSELRKAYSTYCRTHKVHTVSDKSIKINLMQTMGADDQRKTVIIDGVEEFVWVWVGVKFVPDLEKHHNLSDTISAFNFEKYKKLGEDINE